MMRPKFGEIVSKSYRPSAISPIPPSPDGEESTPKDRAVSITSVKSSNINGGIEDGDAQRVISECTTSANKQIQSLIADRTTVVQAFQIFLEKANKEITTLREAQSDWSLREMELVGHIEYLEEYLEAARGYERAYSEAMDALEEARVENTLLCSSTSPLSPSSTAQSNPVRFLREKRTFFDEDKWPQFLQIQPYSRALRYQDPTSHLYVKQILTKDSGELLWISDLEARIIWPQSLDLTSNSTSNCATDPIDIHRGLITLPSHRYDALTQSWTVPTIPIKPGQTRELVHQSRASSRNSNCAQGSVEWKYLGRYACVWEELVEMEEIEGVCDKRYRDALRKQALVLPSAPSLASSSFFDTSTARPNTPPSNATTPPMPVTQDPHAPLKRLVSSMWDSNPSTGTPILKVRILALERVDYNPALSLALLRMSSKPTPIVVPVPGSVKPVGQVKVDSEEKKRERKERKRKRSGGDDE